MGDREVLESEIWKLGDKLATLVVIIADLRSMLEDFMQFATCDRSRALFFLQEVYPSKNIEDTPESAGSLLDLVEQDVVRIQDPSMYGKRIQVVPGTNWKEETREQVTQACMIFHGKKNNERI